MAGLNSSLERALGGLVGAAVGDAAGAVLEFWPGHITSKEVDHALSLPGGGCWRVGPGQFTDDTELALCQAHGLVGHPPSAGFPADSVAREYAWWYNESEPFDVGSTTAQAFGVQHFRDTPPGEFAPRLQANVQNEMSLGSKSNGATMRATPLAIWAHRLEPGAIAAAAAADAGLSHPSRVCRDANAVYVLAVACLIRRPGDAAAALAAAETWAAEHACDEVAGWLAAAWDDAAMAGYDALHKMGFVKHGVQLAFYHLRRHSGFVEGLRHVLLAGGDTDTNAAIVCGMLGALHGASVIPAEMRRQVETYEWKGGAAGSFGVGCVRPERLRGSQLALLAHTLYDEAVRDVEAE